MEKVLIVEDNQIQAEYIRDAIIDKYTNFDIYICNDYSSAHELIVSSIASNQTFSLFIFDIQLSLEKGDRGGFLLAEKVRSYSIYSLVPILFLTAISDEGIYALNHFHCYSYISKPYHSKDIQDVLKQLLFTGLIKNTLVFTDINRFSHKIDIGKILFVHSKGHKLEIHTSKSLYVTRNYSLLQIQDLLGISFVQCHKSYLINKNHPFIVDKNNLAIHIDNQFVPIGKKFLSYFI